MELRKYTHITGISVLTLLAFFALGSISQGSDGVDASVRIHRKTIERAQHAAEPAHKVLESIRESERRQETVVNGLSETADAARKAICALGEEHCTKANLDPANKNVDLTTYQSFR